MIELNDLKKYDFIVEYGVFNDDKTELETIAKGKYFEFIPQKGDIVILEGENYLVINILYDFDISKITIIMKKALETS